MHNCRHTGSLRGASQVGYEQIANFAENTQLANVVLESFQRGSRVRSSWFWNRNFVVLESMVREIINILYQKQ